MSLNRNSTRSTKPATLLVYVTGDRIGDGLLKYPVLRAFRAACPDTRITWVTGLRPSVFATRLATLTRGLIDEIHMASGLGQRLFAPLPAFLAARYDVVLSSEARLRDTLALRRIRCGRLISPAWRFLFSAQRPAIDYASASSYERFTELMSMAAGQALAPRAVIDIPPQLASLAMTLLPEGECYIGFCPGAGGASKRWPAERFIELARRQVERGRVPVFFLGPEEQHLREVVAKAVRGVRFVEEEAAALSASGALVSIALSRRLTMALSNDSGGGHLLSAGGRPVIKLYGHTSAHKFRSPYGEQLAIDTREFGGSSDVAAIPLDHVDSALEAQLARILA